MMAPSMKSMREEALRIIGEAVGEASMCWDPLPGSQVFDSTRASKIVDETAKKLKIAMFGGICKSCGVKHKPKCDKCGRTTDLRSWHGPCGRCAFPNGVDGKKKRASVEDAAEQAHNVLINTHFFLKDNRDGLHPAYARRVRELETGMRTLVKELDQYAPRTAHTYADGHAENCKTASVGGWAAGKAQNAAKYLRSLPHAIPRNVGNTVKGFANPVASMRKGWHSDNNLGRSLTVGFAGMDAMDAMKKNDPSGRGRGRAERVGAAIGNTAGGLIGLPHGTFSGGLVGSAIGSYVGGKAGRMVDGAVKVVRKPSVPKTVAPVEAV